MSPLVVSTLEYVPVRVVEERISFSATALPGHESGLGPEHGIDDDNLLYFWETLEDREITTAYVVGVHVAGITARDVGLKIRQATELQQQPPQENPSLPNALPWIVFVPESHAYTAAVADPL